MKNESTNNGISATKGETKEYKFIHIDELEKYLQAGIKMFRVVYKLDAHEWTYVLKMIDQYNYTYATMAYLDVVEVYKRGE